MDERTFEHFIKHLVYVVEITNTSMRK